MIHSTFSSVLFQSKLHSPNMIDYRRVNELVKKEKKSKKREGANNKTINAKHRPFYFWSLYCGHCGLQIKYPLSFFFFAPFFALDKSENFIQFTFTSNIYCVVIWVGSVNRSKMSNIVVVWLFCCVVFVVSVQYGWYQSVLITKTTRSRQ